MTTGARTSAVMRLKIESSGACTSPMMTPAPAAEVPGGDRAPLRTPLAAVKAQALVITRAHPGRSRPGVAP